MPSVLLYGSSDDLIEVDGTAPGCDEYNAEDAHFVVLSGERRTRVRVWYTKRGVWAIAAAPVDEDVPMAPLRIHNGEKGYSAYALFEDVDQVIREAQ